MSEAVHELRKALARIEIDMSASRREEQAIPSISTISSPSRLLVVSPYFRQCTPPEFSAILPPIEQAICEEGSGA